MDISLGDVSFPRMGWLDFKALVLFKGKRLKEKCAKLGISKPPMLRPKCFEQVASGEGIKLYFDELAKKSGKSA